MRRFGVYLALIALIGTAILPQAPVVAGLSSDLPPGLSWADICNGDHGPTPNPAVPHEDCAVCILGACKAPNVSTINTGQSARSAPNRVSTATGYAADRHAGPGNAPISRPFARGPPALNG